MLLDLHSPTNGYSRTMNAADKKQLSGFGWSWDLSLNLSIPLGQGKCVDLDRGSWHGQAPAAAGCRE